MENDSNRAEKKQRTRSPAYPAIDLEQAIEKASILWKRASRHPVQADVVVTFWGYDKGSSSGLSALSALKKFGLVEDFGKGEGRQVKLTDLGISLVFNPDVNSETYTSKLKQAALLPSIHEELWTKYEGNLPHDTVIEHYLVVDRRFNEQYVKSFIDDFRKTLSFAKLQMGDIVAEQEITSGIQTSGSVQPVPTVVMAKQPSQQQAAPIPPNQYPQGVVELPIPLDDGRVARIPYPMSEDTFELLVETLKLWKKRLVKQVEVSGEAIPPSA